MTHTTNYNLNKLESTDTVQNAVTALNSNMDIIDSAFGGMKLSKLTKSAYDALATKDGNTLYTVTDGNKVTQYLGETELKSGSTTIGIGTPAAKGVTTATAGVGQIVNE